MEEEEKALEQGTPDMPEEKRHDIKMVIVMRRDLGMRKGKIAAQAGHACVEATLQALQDLPAGALKRDPEGGWTADADTLARFPAARWLAEGEKKVCVYVDGEERLCGVAEELRSRGIRAAVIMDAGHTEFHGHPTLTCLATEPRPSAELDPVTGTLPLF